MISDNNWCFRGLMDKVKFNMFWYRFIFNVRTTVISVRGASTIYIATSYYSNSMTKSKVHRRSQPTVLLSIDTNTLNCYRPVWISKQWLAQVISTREPNYQLPKRPQGHRVTVWVADVVSCFDQFSSKRLVSYCSIARSVIAKMDDDARGDIEW